MRFSSESTYRPSRPLTTSASGEAGLTDRVISSDIPLAWSRNVLDHCRGSARLYNSLDAGRLVVRQERPDTSGVFLGQRDGRLGLAASGAEGSQPATPVLTLGVDSPECRACALPAACTPRAIPACAHPEPLWLTSRGVFLRDQAQPGRQLECPRIVSTDLDM